MAHQFIAKKDFWSPHLKSQYVKGMTYTCRDGKDYAKLREALPAWEADGKISMAGIVADSTAAAAAPARMRGRGKVI